MWRAATLLAVLAVLAARPAAAARELHGLESSLPAGGHAPAAPRRFFGVLKTAGKGATQACLRC